MGRACILENDEEKSHGLRLIMRQYAKSDFVFPKESLDKVIVARVDIENITGRKSGY